jgi:hypothetical protein
VQDAGPAGLDVLGLVEAASPLPETVDVAAFGPAAVALDLVGSYSSF